MVRVDSKRAREGEGEPKCVVAREEVHLLQKGVQNVLEGEQASVALITGNPEANTRVASNLNSGMKTELIACLRWNMEVFDWPAHSSKT